MLMPRHTLRQHRRVRWLLGQSAIVTAGVFCYFQVRGLTAADPAVAADHAQHLMGAERAAGIDVEAAVQAPFAASAALTTVVNWVYIWGHWPLILLTMVWLGWQHRWAFLRLRDAMLVSGGLGLLAFATYPVAPPRLVERGLVDTITERSHAYRVLQPPNFVNQYAAMPSLHAGWDLLVGLSIVSAGGTLMVRTIGWILPLLMAIAVIATANHYVVDVVAGIAFALIGYVAALAFERRRARRARPARRLVAHRVP